MRKSTGEETPLNFLPLAGNYDHSVFEIRIRCSVHLGDNYLYCKIALRNIHVRIVSLFIIVVCVCVYRGEGGGGGGAQSLLLVSTDDLPFRAFPLSKYSTYSPEFIFVMNS